MSKYDVVVLGGGISGLFAAAKLVKEKNKVLLIEQHDKLGGYTSFFNRKGFRFEASLHALNGLSNQNSSEYKLFSELGLFEQLELIELEELCHVIGNEFEANIYADIEKCQTELIDIFPYNEKEIRKIYQAIVNIADQIESYSNLKFKDYLKLPLVLYKHRNMIGNLFCSLTKFLNKYTDNEKLKNSICAEVLYYHTNPDTYSFIHFAAAKTSFLRDGASHIVGGSFALAKALQNYIITNGGEISLNSLANNITLNNKTVKSVSYKIKRSPSIKEVTTKAIISTIAYPNLLQLLGENKHKLPARYNKLEHSSSVFTVYLGLKNELSSIGIKKYSTILFPKEYQKISDMKYCLNTVNYKNSIKYLTNYSALNIFPEHGNKPTLCCTTVDYIRNWDSLSKEEYKLKKNKHANQIIDSLDKRYPGLKHNIELINIATPKTYARYTLNPSGAIYGFAQNTKQIAPFRPKHKTKIKGLYVAGAWSTPSGGVMPSAKSGNNAAQKVINYLLKFRRK